jgi:hypothetical protein
MKNKVPYSTKIVSNEEGFAIPIALGMGLIMILLATTAVVRSQNGQVVAINKKAAAQSLVAAETGISRVQDFLNRNRAATSVQACATPNASLGACPDSSPTVSWDVPGEIPNFCDSDASTTGTNFSTTDTNLTNNNGWQDVDTSDANKGQFRIVSYTYTTGATVSNLTVEGRLNGGSSGEAKTRLQVQIPVSDPKAELVASLWVSGSIADSPQMDADVVVPCSATTFPTFLSGTQHLSIKTNQTMPGAIIAPTTAITAPITAPTLAPSSSFYPLTNLSTIPGKELPRTTANGYTSDDQPDADGIYRYIVTSFDDSFKVTPGKEVWLWVEGDLDLSNKIVVNQCGTSDPLVCGPFKARIYPKNPGTTQTLTLNKGTAICDVFFHLPDYNVSFSSTGTTPTQNCSGTNTNTGIYWVKNWSGAASGITLLNPPRATWNTAITETGMSIPALSPRIGPLSQWETRSN